MTHRKGTVSIVVVLVGTLALCVGSAEAQKSGKTRPAKTSALMKGIMQPRCGGIGAALKDSGPADDKAWDALATDAACLNEMGHLLMDDGRCPDADWAGACKTLKEGSAAVLAAAEKKDLAAAKTAFEATTKACAACHSKHK